MIIIKTKKYKECFCYFLTIVGVIVVLFFVFCGVFFIYLLLYFWGCIVSFSSRKKKPSDIVAIDDGSGQLVATTAETTVKVKEVVHEAPSIEVGDGFPPPPCTHPVIHVAAGDGLGFV